MVDVWYVLLGAMLTGYVILDGFDLGVGAVHILLGRKEGERRAMIRSIGPIWDGNEVWLIATGGVLICAFPAGYASAFAGFYLPLIMVLWLLIFRGLAIELRSHIDNPLWRQLWDVLFSGSSTALALFLGVALGNVVRGVDLDESGRFFLPLWTDWSTTGPTGVLDWYTVLVGLLAVVTLGAHGATWITLRTEGDLAVRARRLGLRLGVASAVGFLLVSSATAWVAPHVRERISEAPWGVIFFALPFAAWWFHRRRLAGGRPLSAFLGSSAAIAALTAAAIFGVYPNILPATQAAAGESLTAAAAAASEHGLRTAIRWWVPAAVLVTVYQVIVYRGCREPIHVES